MTINTEGLFGLGVLVGLTSIAVVACEQKIKAPSAEQEAIPRDYTVTNYGDITEYRLVDGTRCMKAVGPSGSSIALSCDFRDGGDTYVEGR